MEEYRNQLTDFTYYIKKTTQRKRIKPAQIDEYIFKINQKFLDYSEKQIEERASKTPNNIKKIMNNGKVRIINSGKNLGPVAVYTTYYHKQVLKILGKTVNYKEIKTWNFPATKSLFYGNEMGLQTKPTPSKRLRPKLPQIYILMKLHKNSVGLRPITGATDWITTNLSKALAVKLLQYQNNHYVESQYPSIDLQTHYKTLYSLTYSNEVVNATKLICENNYFEYNNKLYQQIMV
ncbi:hypothetical protein BB561_006333 [Smittium simulii]|uniref:Uncharacterized protein n=1 Tax=Smittium simulii TaxID=133385 RepID=A0A2T9Y510_9FUNG|nr:hypothetical protein BB561_006333 [Smittium simulii]